MQHQALGSPGLPKNICKLCGRSEVTVESWTADRTERIGVKVVPVPDDYPYCWTCYHTGDAMKDGTRGLFKAVTDVTGTRVSVGNTGGGTMTGFVELFPDSDIVASFCIMHDDDTAESCGHFTLELWSGHDVDPWEVQEGYDDRYDVGWLEPLTVLWESARLQVDPRNRVRWSPAMVGQWFRLVWDETVRVIDENRDKWEVK